MNSKSELKSECLEHWFSLGDYNYNNPFLNYLYARSLKLLGIDCGYIFFPIITKKNQDILPLIHCPSFNNDFLVPHADEDRVEILYLLDKLSSVSDVVKINYNQDLSYSIEVEQNLTEDEKLISDLNFLFNDGNFDLIHNFLVTYFYRQFDLCFKIIDQGHRQGCKEILSNNPRGLFEIIDVLVQKN